MNLTPEEEGDIARLIELIAFRHGVLVKKDDPLMIEYTLMVELTRRFQSQLDDLSQGLGVDLSSRLNAFEEIVIDKANKIMVAAVQNAEKIIDSAASQTVTRYRSAIEDSTSQICRAITDAHMENEIKLSRNQFIMIGIQGVFLIAFLLLMYMMR